LGAGAGPMAGNPCSTARNDRFSRAGTRSSNPASSSGESANFRSLARCRDRISGGAGNAAAESRSAVATGAAQRCVRRQKWMSGTSGSGCPSIGVHLTGRAVPPALPVLRWRGAMSTRTWPSTVHSAVWLSLWNFAQYVEARRRPGQHSVRPGPVAAGKGVRRLRALKAEQLRAEKKAHDATDDCWREVDSNFRFRTTTARLPQADDLATSRRIFPPRCACATASLIEERE